MIRDVTLIQWLVFAGAFLLSAGPGYLLYSLFFSGSRIVFRLPASLVMALGFSVSFWVVLLLWMRVFYLSVTPLIAFILSITGWVLSAVYLFRKSKTGKTNGLLPRGFDYLDTGLFLLSFAAGLWGLRNEVAGMGSDSFHHTLIAEMIFKHGQIPYNYLPYASIITFSYHYGFHAFTALLAWLSQWPARLIIVALGPILVALTGYAAGMLVRAVTGSRAGGLVAFAIVSILAVFPTTMLNWGRYPQVFGSFLLLLFLVVFIEWRNRGYRLRQAPLVALFAIGLSLTHYRVTGMAIAGVIVFLLVEVLFTRGFFRQSRRYLFAWAAAVLIGIVLIAPWVINTYLSHNQGIAIVHPISEEQAFFSIERVGTDAMQYPTNLPLLGISAAAVLFGLWKKDTFVIWVALWWLALYLTFQPRVLGAYFDSVTFFISLFIPASLLCGWLAAQIFRQGHFRWPVIVSVSLASAVCLIWGISLLIKIPTPQISAFVHASDLETTGWIKTNTPDDALFMVNTYHFPFAKEFIIGIDAGYWLPVLSDRRTVVPPMSYQTERFSSSQMQDNLMQLHALKGNLATPDAVKLMRDVGVQYIYVSSRGGPIQTVPLLQAPDFRLVHENSGNYVFQLVP